MNFWFLIVLVKTRPEKQEGTNEKNSYDDVVTKHITMDVWDKERRIDFVSCNPDTYIDLTIHQHSRKTSVADKTK